MTYYAGKAIGLRMTDLATRHIAQGVSPHAIIYRNEAGGDSVFDPFNYGADSIQLMAWCEMHIQCMDGAVSITSPRLSTDLIVDYDKYASREQAIRAAVLLVAATIGYGMEVDRLAKRDAANDS
ncbi:MAG: hypothetical protein KGI04_04995 [Candidatus Micrarchaeota archaeon]|nr:hypothetical protein [Candidatus Micrarchaeota archaeon]